MLMDYSNSLFFLEQSKRLSKTLSFQHILNFYQAGLLSLGKHLWDCLSNWELTLTNWQSNIRCECTLLYYGTEKRFLRVHWIFVWVQPILLNLILHYHCKIWVSRFGLKLKRNYHGCTVNLRASWAFKTWVPYLRQ